MLLVARERMIVMRELKSINIDTKLNLKHSVKKASQKINVLARISSSMIFHKRKIIVNSLFHLLPHCLDGSQSPIK